MVDDDQERNLVDRRSQIDRKLRDAAALLPMVGAALLATPLLSVAGEILGGPIYFAFLTWAVLIAVAWALARRLGGGEGGG